MLHLPVAFWAFVSAFMLVAPFMAFLRGRLPALAAGVTGPFV